MGDAMTSSDNIRNMTAALDRAQRKRILFLMPAAIAFVAGGVLMVRSGEPFGWAAILFFGAALPAFPMLFARTYRKSRYRSGPLVARRLLFETLLSVVIALAAGAGALALGLTMGSPMRPMATLAGYGGGALFLFAALLALFRAFDRRPVVNIDPEGYFDRRAMRRPLAWSQVIAIHRIEYRSQTMFFMEADGAQDNETLTTRLNHAFGFHGYSLHANALDCTVADLLLAIETNRPASADHTGFNGSTA
jgi:hypothetical protein